MPWTAPWVAFGRVKRQWLRTDVDRAALQELA
jgi:hypothetical protein